MAAPTPEAVFGTIIIKAVTTLALLAVGMVLGHIAARRVPGGPEVRRAAGKVLAIAIGAGLVYLLVLSRFSVV